MTMRTTWTVTNKNSPCITIRTISMASRSHSAKHEF